MLDFEKAYSTPLGDMLHLLPINILLRVKYVKRIGFAPSAYFKLLFLMWISANSFRVGSSLSTIKIVLGSVNLPLTRISSLQITHRFSLSSSQDDSYLYCCRTLFLSVSTSFVVSCTDS